MYRKIFQHLSCICKSCIGTWHPPNIHRGDDDIAWVYVVCVCVCVLVHDYYNTMLSGKHATPLALIHNKTRSRYVPTICTISLADIIYAALFSPPVRLYSLQTVYCFFGSSSPSSSSFTESHWMNTAKACRLWGVRNMP